MIELSAEDLERVEAALKDDVSWAVLNRKWNPGIGAIVDDGHWIESGTGNCGTCAIGSHVVRRQVPLFNYNGSSVDLEDGFDADDCASAAESLKVDALWIRHLYVAVAAVVPDDRNHNWSEQTWQLSRRLRAHADAEAARLEAPQP